MMTCPDDAKRFPIAIEFTSKDILCGREMTAFSHEGTQRFRSFISKNRNSYLTAPGRAARAKLAQGLSDQIFDEGFVFWKKDVRKGWCRLSVKEAGEKVRQTLHDSIEGGNKCIKQVPERVLKHEELQTRTMQIFQDLIAKSGGSIDPKLKLGVGKPCTNSIPRDICWELENDGDSDSCQS